MSSDPSLQSAANLFERAQDVSVVNSSLNVVGRDQINVDQSVHTHVYHGAIIAAATIGPSDSKKAADHSNLPEGPIKNAPNPSTLFQGRRSELDELKKYFRHRAASNSFARRSLLVYGMGGMGKTQLCRKFAEETSDQFTHIFWIDGSTPETISLALKNLAGPKTTTSDNAVSAALQWISRLDGEWLLVFDNAEEHIHRFIPPGTSGNILITSRNRSVGRSTGFNAMEIHQMEEEDAVALLLKASCIDHTPESINLHDTAKAIVNALYCLPLAVDQAGAAIESGLCSINDYLQLYSRCRKRLLDDPFFRKASEYEQTVYGTWELSFQKIESISLAEEHPGLPFSPQEAHTAIAILGIFAYLHHDSISPDIFEAAWTNMSCMDSSERPAILDNHDLLWEDEHGNWDELHFKQGIRVLLGFSLIKQVSSTASYNVHPLVHSWSQDRLPYSTQQRRCQEATKLLSYSVSYRQTANNLQFCQHLIPHIQANGRGYTSLSSGVTYDKDDCFKFGFVFQHSGVWLKAEELYRMAWQICTRELGTEHPDTLTSMANLASTFRNQGRWEEAKTLEVEVLDIRKRVLGIEHPSTLTSKNNLALTFQKQGRWNEAEELQVEVHGICKRMLGTEHPDTLTSKNNLALTFRKQGRWNEAEELQVEELGICKRVLGTEHPDTLTSMANLASTFWTQGRFKEAEELQVKVLGIHKRMLGTEHPDTLANIGNLALTFMKQGRWKEAEELQAEVLGIRKRVLGIEHPSTLTSMASLATTFRNQGRWKEAEELQVAVLGIHKRVLGTEHPDTLASIGNLAFTFMKQGRWKEAESLQVQILDIRTRVLGKEHPDTLQSVHSLGLTYQSQQRWNKAEELLTHAVELSRKVIGDDHPDTRSRVSDLSDLFDKKAQANASLRKGSKVKKILKRAWHKIYT